MNYYFYSQSIRPPECESKYTGKGGGGAFRGGTFNRGITVYYDEVDHGSDQTFTWCQLET